MADKSDDVPGRPQRPSTKARSRTKVLDGSVGPALRSVYQQTVHEDVPQDFLDLLGRLD